MAKQPLSLQLKAALRAELVALEHFSHLLQQEQSLLLDNRAEELLQLAKQKMEATQAVALVSDERLDLLAQAGVSATATAVEITTHLSRISAELLPLWQQLLQQADVLRQLNNTNGELIKMRLRHNQQALAVLDNSNTKLDLYGRDGQRNFTPGSGRPLARG